MSSLRGMGIGRLGPGGRTVMRLLTLAALGCAMAGKDAPRRMVPVTFTPGSLNFANSSGRNLILAPIGANSVHFIRCMFESGGLTHVVSWQLCRHPTPTAPTTPSQLAGRCRLQDL